MELVVQLVLTVIVFGVTLSGGSLVWPRVTSSPRPKLLQEVHDTVIKTGPGSSAAQVLGVSDDQTVQPINLGEIATNALNSLKNTAQKRATTIIMAQVTQQLSSQYDRLSSDQKIELQKIVCEPIQIPAVK